MKDILAKHHHHENGLFPVLKAGVDSGMAPGASNHCYRSYPLSLALGNHEVDMAKCAIGNIIAVKVFVGTSISLDM